MIIEVGNSYSQVKQFTQEEFRGLKKILCYETDAKAAYFAGGFVRKKYLIDSKGFFPTGLLELVTEHFDVQLIDKRARPGAKGLFSLRLTPDIVPYLEQLEAAEAVVKNHRCGIVMPTGSGKSLVIALIASRLQVRTLVVVPTLELKKQLKNTLSVLLKGHQHITVENIGSSSLDEAKDYDCLIIDECHHSAAKTYQTLNKTAWKGIYYRVFLTATYFRNETNEQLLFEGIAGKPAYELSYNTAVSKGYIMPVEAFYLDLPKQAYRGYTWAQVYNELVVNNVCRNETIVSLCNTLDVPTLVLVKEIEHGQLLSEMTGIPFVNGQDADTRGYIDKFNSGAIKALIGTIGVLGEGVDTKPAEFIIIAGLGKAKSQFMQSVGRGLRKYPGKESTKIILFKDPSHKWTLSHFKAQKKILLDEYGVQALNLVI